MDAFKTFKMMSIVVHYLFVIFYFFRHTRLQGCIEHCRSFHSAMEKFVSWMQQAEDKMEGLEPISFFKLELEKQIKEIQASCYNREHCKCFFC